MLKILNLYNCHCKPIENGYLFYKTEAIFLSDEVTPVEDSLIFMEQNNSSSLSLSPSDSDCTSFSTSISVVTGHAWPPSICPYINVPLHKLLISIFSLYICCAHESRLSMWFFFLAGEGLFWPSAVTACRTGEGLLVEFWGFSKNGIRYNID